MGIFEYDFDEHMRMIGEEHFEQGLEQGREQGQIDKLLQVIKSLMETMGWTAEETMDNIKVTESDREAVRPLL